MQLLKLDRSRLAVGEPLPWNVRDGNHKLLLTRGHVIGTEAQLALLLQLGMFVDIEEVKAAAAAARAAVTAQAAAPLTLFDQWRRIGPKLGRTLKTCQSEPGFVERIEALATEIGALMERDTDIGIFLAVRQDLNQLSVYGLNHSIHTAQLCILMARRLGWSPEKLSTLTMAALTMNIAIVELQGKLAAQEWKVNETQRAAISLHPAQGVEMLRGAGVTDEEWLATVANHHERSDGSGYPIGTKENTELVLALRHADVFMAKISHRAARPSLPIQEAERQLFREDGGGPLSMAIIKEFGIYPPGDFVQLKSGEQAVVVQRRANANAPIAAAVTDRSGMPVTNTTRRDTASPEFAIVGLVADKSLAARVPAERLYGLRS